MKFIFDWGGVLTKDNTDDNFINNIEKETGTEIDKKYLIGQLSELNYGHISFRDFYTNTIEKYGLNINEEKFRHLFVESTNPDYGMHEFIKTLNGELYLLSNNDKVQTENIKRRFRDLFSHFRRLYFSCEMKMKKPDRAIFEHVLKDINAKPGECVFIDDREDNIRTADKMGFRTILFRDKNQLEKEIKNL